MKPVRALLCLLSIPALWLGVAVFAVDPALPAVGGQIRMPAGEYTVGDDNEADCRPIRTVRLKAFMLDRHAVTNRQYADFLRRSGYRPRGGFAPSEAERHPLWPAVSVTLEDARAYARSLAMRLPSEEEWEAAARTAGPWPEGAELAQMGNYFDNVYVVKSLVDVFRFPPTPAGFYIDRGNIYEWTDSVYPARFLQGAHAGSRPVMVLKGAAYTTYIGDARPAARIPFPADRHLPWLGFRCARQSD